MKMEQIDALIRALVNEPEQAQRESLGEILRNTLRMEQGVSSLVKHVSQPLAREIVEIIDKYTQEPKPHPRA